MMQVFLKNSPKDLMGAITPIVIETNLGWAIPYWTSRKKKNPNIYWIID